MRNAETVLEVIQKRGDQGKPLEDIYRQLFNPALYLLADRCEVCGKTGKSSVHHIRKLADLDKQGQVEKPAWAKQMAARRRKTLVICRDCHTEIHNVTLSRQLGLK